MGFWDQYVGGSSSSASQNNSAPAVETSTPSSDSGNNWGGSGNSSGSSGSNEYLGEYWSSQAANNNNDNADNTENESKGPLDWLRDNAGRDGNSVWTNALFGSSDSSAKATPPQNSNAQAATAVTTGQTPATGQTSSVLDNSDYYNFARNPAFRQYLQQRDPNAFNEGMQRMQSSNPYLNFDTSNAYGRTGSGYNDYSYSYHTQQLQHQLNQQIMRSNAQARQNGQPQQPLLKEDGLMGYKTMQAMQQYGIDMGMGGSYSGGSTTGGATTGGSGQSPQGMAPSGGRTPASTSQDNGSPRNPNGYVSTAGLREGSEGSKSGRGTTGVTPKHDDAWYAAQYESITGKPPRTDILSPDRIRDFVDQELANQRRNATAADFSASVQSDIDEQQARNEARLNEINTNRDETFTPRLQYDLKNGKSVEQILSEGDLSYNRWIRDNWDDLSSTYNLGDNFPGSDKQAEQLNLYSELEDTYRGSTVDRYGRTGESQAGDSMSRALENRKPSDAKRREDQLALYDELAQLYRDSVANPRAVQGNGYVPVSTMPAATNGTPRDPINYNAMADELFQMDRNDWYSPDRTYNNNYQTQREPINYNAMADELFQTDRNDWYSPDQTYNSNYQEQLAQMQAGQPAQFFAPFQDSEAANEAMRSNMNGNLASKTPLGDVNAINMMQFRDDMNALRAQFPGYSDTALADMVLFNEEMRNGQSSYYKWLAKQLG